MFRGGGPAPVESNMGRNLCSSECTISRLAAMARTAGAQPSFALAKGRPPPPATKCRERQLWEMISDGGDPDVIIYSAATSAFVKGGQVIPGDERSRQ